MQVVHMAFSFLKVGSPLTIVDFSYDMICDIDYYNDECSMYREHMVTVHETMHPLDNK
jgi:hypothetical protein